MILRLVGDGMSWYELVHPFNGEKLKYFDVSCRNFVT